MPACRTPCAIVLLLVASVSSADTALPEWLAGDWCSRNGAHVAEEHWLAGSGGMMLGTARTVTPGRSTQFEFLRIESVDGVPTYLAQPQGAPVTPFKRTAGGDGWIRFENPEHDFPRRVEYRRSGAMLHAEIAGPGPGGKERVMPYEFRACNEDAAALVRDFFEAFNRHDLDAVVNFYAPDALLESSDFEAPRHGREGARRTYAELFEALPTVRDEVKAIVVDGETVAVEFESRWDAHGEVPAGKLPLATFFKLRSGLIARDATYFDAEPRSP